MLPLKPLRFNKTVRCVSLGTETLGHGHSSLDCVFVKIKTPLFTLVLDCKTTPTEWKVVSDQTWICPATVRACAHAAALTVMSTNHAPGEAPHVVEVKDQRLSAFLVSLLLGVSVQLSSVLKQVQQCNAFKPRQLGLLGKIWVHHFLMFFRFPSPLCSVFSCTWECPPSEVSSSSTGSSSSSRQSNTTQMSHTSEG